MADVYIDWLELLHRVDVPFPGQVLAQVGAQVR